MDGEIVINIREEKEVSRYFGFKKVIEVNYNMRGFLFNMHAWGFLQGYAGVPLSEFDIFSDETGITLLLLSANNAYNLEHDITEKYTEEEVKRWIQLMSQRELNDIIQCMLESKINGKTINELAKEGEIKKKSGLKK